MQKHFYILILLLILIFSSCTTPGDDNSETKSEPGSITVKSVNLGPPLTINNSGSVQITADLDIVDTSLDSIWFKLYSPSKLLTGVGAEISVDNFTYNSSTGLYESTYQFENYHESGKWNIGFISFFSRDLDLDVYRIDKDISTTYYITGLMFGDITDILIPQGVTVNTTGADTNCPTLNSVTAAPTTINGTGTVSVGVNISDTGGSGIAEISGGLVLDIYSYHISKYLGDFTYNSTSGLYEATYEFDSDDENGTYYVEIRIEDKAGNKSNYIYDQNDSTQYYTVRYNSGSDTVTTIPLISVIKNY